MPSKMNTVVLRDVAFEYPQGRRLFHNISYSFQSEVVALVGVNGVGKSTLAELMTGHLHPTEGEVVSCGEVILLQQEAVRPPGVVSEYLLEIWDNPLFDPSTWLPLIENLNQEQTLASLSGGEWMRLRLVQILSRQPSLLILDEPTNNLDDEGRKHIYHFVENYADPLMLITHDRALLEKVNRIIELSSEGMRVYGGNYACFKEARKHEEHLLESRIESAKLEKDRVEQKGQERVTHQEKRNRKAHQRSLSGGLPRILRGALKRKAQVTLGKVQVEASEASLQSKERLLKLQAQKAVTPDFALDFADLKLPAGKLVFDLQEFNLYYPGQKQFLWKEDLTWSVRGPERWALTGRNGVGKSSLIKLICGEKTEAKHKGRLELGKVHWACLDQEYGLLKPELSLVENILEVTDIGATEIRNKLARFQFVAEKSLRPIRQLSGGEKLKAALAKILLDKDPIQLLILDEPTNNLDLQSLEILTDSIRNFKGALIVISHDQAFLKDLGLEGVLDLQGPGFAI